MNDLKSNFVGIESPNPFWLASAPPTDKAYNVNRAFEAGWGGVVLPPHAALSLAVARSRCARGAEPPREKKVYTFFYLGCIFC